MQVLLWCHAKIMVSIVVDCDAPITNAKDGLYTETVDVWFGAEEVGHSFVQVVCL